MKQALEAELQPIDLIAERYYRFSRPSRGSMHPLEKIKLLHDGAVLGGGPTSMPDDLLMFEKELDKAPKFTRMFMPTWYASGDPAHVKAERLGISRSSLYTHWKAQLWYFRGVLRTRGLTI